MGCGASATSADTSKRAPAEQEAALGSSGSTSLTEKELTTVATQETSNDRAAECKGPDETVMKIPPLRVTPATKGPLRKGIHVRPSAKCKSQVLFICKDSERVNLSDTLGQPVTANVEIKPFYSADDLKQGWSETGAGAPGVYYMVPSNDVSCCGSIAPSKYMFRWNIGGIRCRSAALQSNVTENIARLPDADLKAKVLQYLHSLEEDPQNNDVEFEERVLTDLASLSQCKSARYLSNNLAGFKSLLIGLEDIMLYNMFDFDLGIENLVGHYQGMQLMLTPKERAQVAKIREISQKKNTALVLEKAKKNIHTSVKEQIKQKLEGLGIDVKTAFPCLDEELSEILDGTEINTLGLTDSIKGRTCSKHHSPELDGQLLARENDPFDVRQRVQNHYRANHQSASPLVPLMCPQHLYHVDFYLVFPKGTKNTFRRAYLSLWEEGNIMHTSRVSMKPYWIGEAYRDTESINSDSEAGESDEELQGDEEGDAESAEESDEDDNPSEAVWKGFFCTVPLQPDIVYCYRIVVDGMAYMSATLKRKSRTNYCKKLKISPKITPWTVNGLKEAELL